jgi:hypothetical protein
MCDRQASGNSQSRYSLEARGIVGTRVKSEAHEEEDLNCLESVAISRSSPAPSDESIYCSRYGTVAHFCPY